MTPKAALLSLERARERTKSRGGGGPLLPILQLAHEVSTGQRWNEKEKGKASTYLGMKGSSRSSPACTS